MQQQRYSISQLAGEFGISSRSIRFYEEKGLISPERSKGNQRIYSKRDRVRLKLILRGKRFGYSLNEIAEMIGIGDIDMDETEQIKKALAKGEQKHNEIVNRIKELKLMEQDMLTIKERLINRLAELEKESESV